MHITSFFFHSKIFLHAPNTQIVRAQIATVHAVRLTRWFEMKNQSLNSCLRWWKKRFHSFIRSFVYNWPRPWSHLCVVFATGIRIPTHRLEAFFNFWTLIGSFLLWNTLFFHDFLLSPVAAVRQQFSVAEFLNFSIWINSNEIGITKITLSGAIVNRNNANCILHFSRPTVSITWINNLQRNMRANAKNANHLPIRQPRQQQMATSMPTHCAPNDENKINKLN